MTSLTCDVTQADGQAVVEVEILVAEFSPAGLTLLGAVPCTLVSYDFYQHETEVCGFGFFLRIYNI